MEMVVGLAFSADRNELLMQLKNRPEVCAGFLNGPGGKVKANEPPVHAMGREFYEETGIGSDRDQWKLFQYERRYKTGNELFFFTTDQLDIHSAVSMTDEPLLIVPLTREQGFVKVGSFPFTYMPNQDPQPHSMPLMAWFRGHANMGMMYNMPYLIPQALAFLEYPQHRYAQQ